MKVYVNTHNKCCCCTIMEIKSFKKIVERSETMGKYPSPIILEKTNAELYELAKNNIEHYGISFIPFKNSSYIMPVNKDIKLVNGYWFEVVKIPPYPMNSLTIDYSEKDSKLSSVLWSYCSDKYRKRIPPNRISPFGVRISDEMHMDLMQLLVVLMQDQGINMTDVSEPLQQKKPSVIKKKKQTISKTTKAKVWENSLGLLGSALCTVCNINTITPFTFQCGHIISEKNGGSATAKNLRPICGMCNLSMGSNNWDDYISQHDL